MMRPIHSFANSCVGSQEWGSHLSHVRQFLEIMQNASMTRPMNLATCGFGKPEVKFVEHSVGSETHRRDADAGKA